jgi:hypothetical protein
MERIRCEYESKQNEVGNFGHVGHGFIEFSDSTVTLVSLAPSLFKEVGCIDIPATCCSSVCCWGCAGAFAYVLFALLFLYVLPKTRTTFPIALVSEVESEDEKVTFAAQLPRTNQTQRIYVKLRTSTDARKVTHLLGSMQ